MPVYNYRCVKPDCGSDNSITCAMKDKPETVACSICKSPTRQIYYSPAVTFSGAGFYSTDKRANDKRSKSS